MLPRFWGQLRMSRYAISTGYGTPGIHAQTAARRVATVEGFTHLEFKYNSFPVAERPRDGSPAF
jgi:hypothetical protein